MRICSLLIALFLGRTTARYQCPHGKPAKAAQTTVDGAPSWTQSDTLKALQDDREPKSPNRHTVNLDLPPAERWLEVGKAYADKSDLIIEYFEVSARRSITVNEKSE